MRNDPRAGLVLIVISIVVCAASLFLLGNALAACTVTWDGMMVLGGVVLLPLPIVLCVQQYRGTFCRVPTAASTAAVLLVMGSGFAALFSVGTLAEFTAEAFEVPWILLFSVLGVAVVGGAAAWANFRWARVLRELDVAPVRNVVRDLLFGLAAVGWAATCTIYLVTAMPPQSAEHVEYETPPFGMPGEATDISFCQGARGTIAYEFNIDEEGFRRWVAEGIGTIESEADNVPLLPIEEPFTISRYHKLIANPTGPDLVTVAEGLFYEWSFEDRAVNAVFDTATKRAYYYRRTY